LKFQPAFGFKTVKLLNQAMKFVALWPDLYANDQVNSFSKNT